MLVLVPEGESAIFDSADVSLFPVPVLQASLGLPLDFEVMARGFSVTFDDETISLLGLGVKKNFKHLIPIPAFPDISAMIAYHNFKASDIIESRHYSFDVMASKKLPIVTPYVGIGFDKTNMNLSYVPTNYPNESVDADVKVTTSRFTLGVNFTFIPFVNIFADYNIGKFQEITAGMAVSIR